MKVTFVNRTDRTSARTLGTTMNGLTWDGLMRDGGSAEDMDSSGRTTVPIFRPGLPPPLGRGGARIPWERTEPQEGR